MSTLQRQLLDALRNLDEHRLKSDARPWCKAREIASRAGVDATYRGVSAALRGLAQRGLVEYRPGVGAGFGVTGYWRISK